MATKVYGYGVINGKGVPVRDRNTMEPYLDHSGLDVDGVAERMNTRGKNKPYRVVELTYEFTEPQPKE